MLIYGYKEMSTLTETIEQEISAMNRSLPSNAGSEPQEKKAQEDQLEDMEVFDTDEPPGMISDYSEDDNEDESENEGDAISGHVKETESISEKPEVQVITKHKRDHSTDTNRSCSSSRASDATAGSTRSSRDKQKKSSKKKRGPIEIDDIRNDSFLSIAQECAYPGGNMDSRQNKWNTLKKDFQNHLRTGSKSLCTKVYKCAEESYHSALEMLSTYPAQDLNVFEADVMVLKYAICIASISTEIYSDIVKGIDQLKDLEGQCIAKLPAIYYALGRAYCTLNRFKVAVEYINSGLAFLEKGLRFSTYTWPGTKDLIPETSREGLESSLKELQEICRVPHKPDAVCRYLKCLELSPHILPTDTIYFTDPGFSGYYVIFCESKCRIEYHIYCWKDFKESRSCSVEKPKDKDILGKECPTTDCINKSGNRSAIVKIEIYNEAAIMKTCLEITAEQAVHESRKSRKKKADRISESEKSKSHTHNRPRTRERPQEGCRENQVDEGVRNQIQDGSQADQNLNREARAVEENTRTRPKKTRVEKPSKKRAEFFPGAQNTSDDEYEERRNFMQDLRQNNFYFRGDFISEIEQEGDEDRTNMVNDESSVEKEFIISYFYEYIREEGSKKEREIREKWSEDSAEFESWNDVLRDVDICDFLISSPQFIKIDNNICLTEFAESVYELAAQEVTETVEFIMRDPVADSEEENASAEQERPVHNLSAFMDDEDVCSSGSENEDDNENLDDSEEEGEGDENDDISIEEIDEDHVKSMEEIGEDEIQGRENSTQDEISEAANIPSEATEDFVSNDKVASDQKNRRESLNPEVKEFLPRRLSSVLELQSLVSESLANEAMSIDNQESLFPDMEKQSPVAAGYDNDIYHSDEDSGDRLVLPDVGDHMILEDSGEHAVLQDTGDHVLLPALMLPVIQKVMKESSSQTQGGDAEVSPDFAAMMEKLKTENMELEIKNSSVQLTVSELEKLNNTLKAENVSFKNELDALKNGLSVLRGENSQLKKEVEQAINEKQTAIQQAEISSQLLETRLKVMEETNRKLREEKKLDLEVFKTASQIKLDKLRQEHKEERRILQSELQEYKEKVNETEMKLQQFQRILEEERCGLNMSLENVKAAAFIDLCTDRIKELKSLGNVLQNLRDPSFSNIALWIKEWENAHSRASNNLKELSALYSSIRDRISLGEKIENYPRFAASPPAMKFGIHDIFENLIRKYTTSYQGSNLYHQPQPQPTQHNIMVPQQNPFYQQQFVNPAMTQPYMRPTNQQFPTAYPNYYLANTQQSTIPTVPYGTLYNQTPMASTFVSNMKNTLDANKSLLPKLPVAKPPGLLSTAVPETASGASEKEKKQTDNIEKIPVLQRETPLSVTSEAAPPTTTTSESLTNNAPTIKTSKSSPGAAVASVDSTNRNFPTIPSSVKVNGHTSPIPEASAPEPSRAAAPEPSRAAAPEPARAYTSASTKASVSEMPSTAAPSSLELAHRANREPKPNQIQGKCLSKLVTELQKRFPLKKSDELLQCVMLVRERNNNSLSGIPMIVIIEKVEKILQEKAKRREGSMGLEKFGTTAWGVSKVPVAAWNKPNNISDESCSICLEMMENNQTVLRCKHSFHTECIKKWLTTDSICPICREYTRLDDEFPPLP